jgi:hypothetical protein
MIYSIAFDPTSTMLAVTSDKGTVHCFHIAGEKDHEKKTNTKSMFSAISGVLPSYFSSEWGFASFKFSESS